MNIDLVLIFIASIVTILFHQYFRRKFSSIYFSLSQLIVPGSDSEDISIRGLILTFIPTFIFSIILASVFDQNYRVLIIAYSFLTSFLVIWPSIIYASIILPYEIYKRRKSLYFIYLLYVLINVAVSIIALSAYNLVLGMNLLPQNQYNKWLSYYLSLHPFHQNIIAGVITTAIIAGSIYSLKILVKNIRVIK